MNILLVKPNPLERAQCEEHIHLLGHDVTACTTAKVALDHCQQQFFPLIIFDVPLSDMTPEKFCRQIRAFPQEKRSLLMACVGLEHRAQIQPLVETGIDDYILKPLDPMQVTLRISIVERRIRHEHAMEILRTAQTYAGNIVESSLDMIIAVDLQRHIVEFNRAAQETFGYRLEEVLGKHVDILYADTAEASRISQTTLQNGRCVQEIMNIRRNGELFPCLLSASILQDQYGRPIGIMGISRDITDLKRGQEALKIAHDELERQNLALARASRLKDEFLSLISHELRTPLTVILSQAELLKERLYGGLNQTQRSVVENIEQNGQHLLNLINDMLDFSKMTHGHQELHVTTVNVQHLCQTSIDAVEAHLHTKHLKLSTRFDPHVTTIQADERLFKQMVLYLLENAVKFTPPGGELGLEVRGDADQHRVHLIVWDTGIGIAQEDIERLFQPFVQLDTRLSREYVGAGLGLAMTYRIVNSHGGHIGVESQIGQGSRFTVTLPWDTSASSEPHTVLSTGREIDRSSLITCMSGRRDVRNE
jgi:PAS domain S-box-containing protein